jgi:leucyl/phenylalanyl-tRNA---protein transferase
MNRIYLLNDSHIFPSVKQASREGLIAIGGDLHPSRVLKAYSQGIFPWYSEGDPIMWWSPDPRMVVIPQTFKPSKSLSRLMRSGIYSVGYDSAFNSVMTYCAKTGRQGQEGTWITDDYQEAFKKLHLAGLAHSVEVYREEKLVGGLYGLSLGKVFFGESMFHLEPNTSKIAFAALVDFMLVRDMTLIDAQQETNHLKNLGGSAVDRSDFLEILKEALSHPTCKGNWGDSKLEFVKINPDKYFDHDADEQS